LLNRYLIRISAQLSSIIVTSAADAIVLNQELKLVTAFSKKDAFIAM
jgi:hypothetical protein